MTALPFFAGILAICLLALAVIDIRRMILPDALTLPLIPLGLLLARWQAPDLAARALGAGLGYGGFVGLAWLYRRWRGRDGLGRGDAKLLAAAGAWVGALALPSVVLIAAVLALSFGLLGALLARRPLDRPLPFGPFLAAGFWLVWRFGPLGV